MPPARAVATLAAAAALCVSPVAAGEAQKTMVIKLISVTTSQQAHDAAPKGWSPGDTVASTSRLLNSVAQFGRPKGAVVGRDRGTARFVAARQANVDGVATLPGGTVHFRGRIRGACRCVISVVGGTGQFGGARGTLVAKSLGRPKLALNVYTLTFG